MNRETVCERWAKTQAIIAANPHHRQRILGIRRYYPQDASTHIISVNCETGARSITKLPPRNSFAMSRAALHSLISRVIDLHLEMKDYLAQQGELNTAAKGPSTEKMIAAVARAAGLRPNDIYGGPSTSRGLPVIHARHLYCYLAAALRPDLSYPAIARTFVRGRHHTTIMHAVQSFNTKRQTIPAVTKLCAHRAVAAYVAKADLTPRLGRC